MVGMPTAYAGPLVQRPIILLATTLLPRVAPIAMRHATSITAAERKVKTIAFDQASAQPAFLFPSSLTLLFSASISIETKGKYL